MDEFSVVTQKDRTDISYALCIGGSVVLGVAVMRVRALPGVLAGAATGLAIGLMTCRRLAPAIEKKLFSTSTTLNDHDLLVSMNAMRDITGVTAKADVIYLLGQARTAMQGIGQDTLKRQCPAMTPHSAAAALLNGRARA